MNQNSFVCHLIGKGTVTKEKCFALNFTDHLEYVYLLCELQHNLYGITLLHTKELKDVAKSNGT